MRHFFSRSVTAGALRMRPPPPAAGLVTRTGRKLTAPPGERAALSGAVNLASVATTANQRLFAASRAEEQPRRRALIVTEPMDVAWISAPFGAILIPHACPARCEGTAPNRTARLRSAPCLVPEKVRFLPRHEPPCQSTAARAAPIKLAEAPGSSQRLAARCQIARSPDRRGFTPPSTA